MANNLIKEADLELMNLTEVHQPPIRPGFIPSGPQGAPPLPNGMSNYFQGSISPVMQHDTYFVDTGYGSTKIPIFPLIPVGFSGSALYNSGIRSLVAPAAIPTIVPVITPTSGQLYEVNSSGIFSPIFSINGTPI